MKLRNYFAASVILVSLAALTISCANEMDYENCGISEITATMGDENAKTVLADNMTSILWNPNDEISVFYNGDGVKFTSINSTPKDRTIFRSQYSLIYGGTETSDDPYIYAVYPYSDTNKQEGENITLTVPAFQTAVEGSFGRGTYPSIGRSKDTNIAFYNVCGGIRFTLCQSGIRKIVLKGNNNETLGGKVKVQIDENGRPKVSAVVEGEKSITLAAPGNGEFQTGKWYYISVLPTVFGNGFNVEFIKRAYESERGTRTVTSSVEVKRSIFGSIENLDNDVVFDVGIGSLSISPAEVLVAPMSSVQLSLTVMPADAKYEWIKWSSTDDTIASVDENGMVTGKKEGICEIFVSSDNGKFASCMVYVSQAPVITKDASEISFFTATLNGSFNLSHTAVDSVFFLYSDTEPTLEGLKTNGIKTSSFLEWSLDFKSSVSNLKDATKYYYVAAVTFLGQTYYGDVRNFTTQSFPVPEMVDLGLPSGLKWASFNLGASAPEEYGGYYQWAGLQDVTDTSIVLDWYNCPYHTGSSYDAGWTKYIPSSKSSYWSGTGSPDNKFVLDLEDDVAHVTLGDKWRMPTREEFDELVYYCTSKWTTLNGVEGMKLTSKNNGNSIFLPAAGFRGWEDLYDVRADGGYWSSSLYTGFPVDARYLCFYSSSILMNDYGRNLGLSVRPVFGESKSKSGTLKEFAQEFVKALDVWAATVGTVDADGTHCGSTAFTNVHLIPIENPAPGFTNPGNQYDNDLYPTKFTVTVDGQVYTSAQAWEIAQRGMLDLVTKEGSAELVNFNDSRNHAMTLADGASLLEAMPSYSAGCHWGGNPWYEINNTVTYNGADIESVGVDFMVKVGAWHVVRSYVKTDCNYPLGNIGNFQEFGTTSSTLNLDGYVGLISPMRELLVLARFYKYLLDNNITENVYSAVKDQKFDFDLY